MANCPLCKSEFKARRYGNQVKRFCSRKCKNDYFAAERRILTRMKEFGVGITDEAIRRDHARHSAKKQQSKDAA